MNRAAVSSVLVMVLALLALCGSLMIAGCGQANPGKSEADGTQHDIASYQSVLAKHPDDLAALSGLGSILMLAGRFDEALPYQERVVALDPTDVQTRVELGFNYLNHQQRADDAVTVLTQAVGIDPSAKNLTFLAQAQEASGALQDAEATLGLAVSTDPTYARGYALLIRLMQQSDRTDEAAALKSQAESNGVDIDAALASGS